MKAKDYDVELIANSRIAVKEGMFLSQLFNPINFFVLTQFSKEFQNDSVMLTVLSSVLHLCRLTDLKSQSQFPYWVPKKDVVERKGVEFFDKLLEKYHMPAAEQKLRYGIGGR